jgi:outer membrane murein-binding lipoprotein Lpp
MPASSSIHTLDDCPQNPVLISINATLARWEKRMERQDDLMERQAVAMETIAAHGVMVTNHEKRLDRHDIDFTRMFSIITDDRKIEKLTSDMEELSAKVIRLEKTHAKEEGAELVEARVQARLELEETEKKKFWTEFKIKMISPVLFGVFFAIWVIDKWNLAEKFKLLLEAFRG